MSAAEREVIERVLASKPLPGPQVVTSVSGLVKKMVEAYGDTIQVEIVCGVLNTLAESAIRLRDELRAANGGKKAIVFENQNVPRESSTSRKG